ncbi:oxidoreductase [Streptomyces tauricus]|uniref:FAD-dependent monooxygenase n=1 Tax=Streptomyces tauricus TaxID=68274 RepID=UPI001674795D|nr:FAD-dependent monooxygenase [Streptomyces tauricus]GHA65165.1 oxidoreductase [Streptomyces tauricus]
MPNREVLILGAGVAGPALAYWLARFNFHPVVVEKARGLRSSGNPVDVKGPAVQVAEKMRIMPQLQAAATGVTGTTLLDLAGRPMARLPMTSEKRRDVEISRADLATIVYEAAHDGAEFLFGDTVVDLTQDPAGVDVTFEQAAPRRFDLVIGSDGIHSTVRRLAFGPEQQYARDLGMYLATVPLPAEAIEFPHDMVVHNSPGRLLLVHPGRDQPMAMFVFRGTTDGYDRRDRVTQKRILADAYDGAGWRAPELVEAFREHPDPYFDRLNAIRIDGWSRGRVGLLGDSASSVAVFGDGSTLAVAGAHTLAEALHAHPEDHARAFRQYEATHRRLVNPKQRQIGPMASVLVPRTARGLTARNAAARALVGVTGKAFAPTIARTIEANP